MGLAVVAAWSPLLRDLSHWGIQDWDQHLFHLAVPRTTLLEHHQFPLWNPYNGSGVPLLANPESRVLAPSFALVLLFGEVVGVKLEILLHMLLGLAGAYLLMRENGLEPIGAQVGSAVFALNSWYAVHLTVGHIWALNIAFLPWVWLFYGRARMDLRYGIATGAVLALMFLGGGVYPLVIALLLLGAIAGTDVALGRAGARRQALQLAIAAAAALALSAVKLLPTAELMISHPRVTPVAGGYDLGALFRALFDRTQALEAAFRTRPRDFNGTTVHEGLYLGAVPALLFVWTLVARGRTVLPWIPPMLLLLWVSLGTRVSPSLWSGMHALPIFDELRMVQRFAIGAILPASLVIGHGFDALRRRVEQRSARPWITSSFALALASAVFADLAAVHARVFDDAFPIPAFRVEAAPVFRQHLRARAYDSRGWVRPTSSPLLSTNHGLYPSFLANRGSTRGYEIVPIPSRAVPVGAPGYRGEFFLEDATGLARVTHWSPNRIDVAVSVPDADRVVVNQNFDPGWRVAGALGRGPEPLRGLLSVPVTATDDTITFHYRPGSFVVGTLISAAAWAGVAILGARACWRRRRAGST